MELCLFALTCLGFVVFKSEAVQNLIPHVWNFFTTGKLVSTVKRAPDVCNPDYLPVKELEANFNSGQFDIVLDSWASLKYLPVTALGAVVQSLLATHKQLEIPDTLKRALSSHGTLRTPEAMHAIEYMLAMHGAGYAIPAPCLTQVLLLAVAKSG